MALIFFLVSTPRRQRLGAPIVISSVYIPPMMIRVGNLPTAATMHGEFIIVSMLIGHVTFQTIPQPEEDVIYM